MVSLTMATLADSDVSCESKSRPAINGVPSVAKYRGEMALNPALSGSSSRNR